MSGLSTKHGTSPFRGILHFDGALSVLGELNSDDSGSHTEDVDIVMLYSLVGGVDVMAKAGPDPGHLVGGDASANAAAAD